MLESQASVTVLVRGVALQVPLTLGNCQHWIWGVVAQMEDFDMLPGEVILELMTL